MTFQCLGQFFLPKTSYKWDEPSLGLEGPDPKIRLAYNWGKARASLFEEPNF